MTISKNKTVKPIKPLILIILDGWGIAPPSRGNAISLGKTPTMDYLTKNYPYTELCAHGRCVGLPDKQEGNSEAGHMNIGAGRVVDQDVIRITKAIKDGTFFKNPAFLEAAKHARKNNSALHLMGLLSNGMSPHSDPEHLKALLEFSRRQKITKVYLHLFTDGRDSPQHSALKLIQELQAELKPNEKIATIIGRYYAMDRKKNWPVTEQAYDALTCRHDHFLQAPTAEDAITKSYNRNNTDEFIEPCVIENGGKILPRINSNDAIIFFNFRSDRARQLAKAFVQKDFEGKNVGAFKRKKKLHNLLFVAMTDFGPDLDSIISAFPGIDVKQTLPMQLKDQQQYYIAETEKYAHVTYFFNGGYADPVAGEQRILVPSPNVKSYDETPEMSSRELTDKLLTLIKKNAFDFIAVNYACPDMIGHTGNLRAGIQAVTAVDKYLAKLAKALEQKNLRAIITADHGNVEEMINLKTGEIDTEHSINPVPFILFDKRLKGKHGVTRKQGILGDIAPTILDLFGKAKPTEMTGKTLMK
ncbi:MAG: 2,3-bisphosphoglycerate-independent phosphoglycerate mutase [Patescibacteria group bacterium]